MSIKIAITDDHPLIIGGLRSMLQHHPDIEIINCYQGGEELMAGLKKQRPEILLLDIQMSGEQGDALAKSINQQYPAISIIALTNLDSAYYINSMLQHANVKGYVLKTSGEDMLLKAIYSVANGKQFLEPFIRERKQSTARQQGVAHLILTRREKEVLQLLALNHSSHDIAQHLFLSKRTVDNHRISLLLKLEVKNSASLIKKAMDLGLIK